MKKTPPWKWLAIAATILVVSILFSWRFELLNGMSFLWGFAIMLVFGVCIVSLQYLNHKNTREYDEKKGFLYCWKRTNEILRTMDNPDMLEWSGGNDKKSTIRSYTVNGKSMLFRAMKGRLQRAKQEVVVIYNIDDDDIWEYVSNPSPRKLNDPWHDFEPVKSSRGFGYRDPYIRSRRNSSMMYPGDFDGGSGGGDMADQEFVERAFEDY